jgi:hypothetical protein
MNITYRRCALAALSGLYFFVASRALDSQAIHAQSIISQQGVQTIALSGMQIPDRFPGAGFGSFDPPVINNLDQVSFTAYIGANSHDDTGVFSTIGGILHSVVLV